jgi:rhodanese-related sulfurtransferase
MPAGPPQERTWEELQTAAAGGGYKILTTDDLAERIEGDPQSLLIVDTRQEWEYRTAHIKGSVVFPVETGKWWWFRNTSKLLALIGPDKDRSLVFY